MFQVRVENFTEDKDLGSGGNQAPDRMDRASAAQRVHPLRREARILLPQLSGGTRDGISVQLGTPCCGVPLSIDWPYPLGWSIGRALGPVEDILNPAEGTLGSLGHRQRHDVPIEPTRDAYCGGRTLVAEPPFLADVPNPSSELLVQLIGYVGRLFVER